MGVDLGRLGLLLATLSDVAELPDPGRLSRRVLPAAAMVLEAGWRYELIAGRYPHSSEIVFSALVRLPVSDTSEVLARPTEEMASRALLLGRWPQPSGPKPGPAAPVPVP
jgi:hypothetical protein